MENPYYIKGTDVLINKYGITDAAELKALEEVLTFKRLTELDRNPIDGNLDYKHLKAIHKYIFDDLYDWAGKARFVTTSKNGNIFLHHGRIKPSAIKLLSELKNDKHLKDLDRKTFIQKAAYYFSELNFIHPFPEGNGRSQRVFFDAIARNAGYVFDWSKANNNEVVIAATHSQLKDNSKLEVLFNKIVPFSTKPDIGIAEKNTVYNSVKAAKAIIKNTADKELANLLNPSREKESNIIEEIRSLKGMLSDTSIGNKVVLTERLTKLQQDLKRLRKDKPKLERKLRAESKVFARTQHPKEANSVAAAKETKKAQSDRSSNNTMSTSRSK